MCQTMTACAAKSAAPFKTGPSGGVSQTTWLFVSIPYHKSFKKTAV
jgi:hypothetical protein